MIKKMKYYAIAALILVTPIVYYGISNYEYNNQQLVVELNSNTLNDYTEMKVESIVEINDHLARENFSYISLVEEIKLQNKEPKEDRTAQNLQVNTASLVSPIKVNQKTTENTSRSQPILQSEEKQDQTQTTTQIENQAETKSESTQSSNQQYLGYNLNSYVLDVIKTYDTSQNYPYLLNTDYANYNGVTANINFAGKTLLKAHPSGIKYSHCTGITFEVFFKAMERRNRLAGLDPQDFNGMSYNDLHDFMLKWYVAGTKQTHNMAVAVENYGIGRRITNFEEAQPGDFIDISRENNTGHTAVFLGWIREDGKIIGLRYWSSQQSTRGINYNTEYFNVGGKNSSKYGNVMINNVYIARVLPINQYRSFR